MFQINFVNYSNQCSASEPELSLITFTGSDSISASSSRFTVTEIPDKGMSRRGDYSREANISNISVKVE